MLDLYPDTPQSMLINRGVPRRTLGLFRPYDLDKCCSQFVINRFDDDGEPQKRPVQAKKQVEWLNRCVNDPYHQPYILYLSDYKSGEIVRSVAAAIFSYACHLHTNIGRERPKWIRLWQGYDLQVPLTGEDRPSFLVIDNCYTDSTAAKVEKLRDILACYDDTPVIVICGTPGSPFALVEQFNLPVTYGALLRDHRAMKKEEEV